MTDHEQLFLEAMQAFHRGYAGPPGVIYSRQVGRTAAGVRAVVDLLIAKSRAAQPLPSARPENSDVNDEPWDAGYDRGWNACLAAAGSASTQPAEQPRGEVLDAAAKVGAVVFKKGAPWSSVVACAQRAYAYKDELKLTPEQTAAFRQAVQPKPEQAVGEPVAVIRHFTYSGLARNGEAMEAVVLDGVPVLPEGTLLYAPQPEPEQSAPHTDPFSALAKDIEAFKGDGEWRSCTGCHDTEDGHPTARYLHSKVLGCEVGSGCHECGGLGVAWQDFSQYEITSDASPSAGAVVPKGSTVLSAEGTKLIAQAIGAHAAVVRFLVDGRPDLALAESMTWVEGFAKAAELVAATPEASS